ncbi:MAG TPA: GntR family transcriptional regulator [Solirubrobacteraceae bacterium]|nr:GntR family transcriptional regulator [Solirubrobacteraceae bacterium]
MTRGFDDLEPVAVESAASMIADQIRQRIMDGSFAPGTQLGEVQLTERIGMSRGPVREAMQRLIQEGLLRAERHRGVFVVELDDDDIADIYLARRAIEGTALTLLAQRRSDDEVFQTIEALVDQMEAAAERHNWADMADLDLRFHEMIVAATGSKRLVRMFRTLMAETRMCLTELESGYAVWRDLVGEHRMLLDLARRGKRGELLRAFQQHLDSAVRDLLASRAELVDRRALEAE